jgi:hypothetical protein
MKIECILKRPGGTKVDLGGTEYHFAPQADGAHVAVVKENAHIQRFLSIPEGYRIYGDAQPVVDDKDEQTAPDEVANDNDPLAGDLNGDGVVDDKDERLALVAAYEAKFGKKPNGRASIETLRKALAE